MSSKTGREVGVLGHAMLGLLAGGPQSGYDLTQLFDRGLRFVWPAKHSQIYPELRHLTELGFVDEGEAGARGRKLYAITQAGRGELDRWMLQPVVDRPQRSETFLRSFFSWTMDPAAARAYFETIEREARAALIEFESIAAHLDPTSPRLRSSRIALEAGLRLTRATAEWASWAADEQGE